MVANHRNGSRGRTRCWRAEKKARLRRNTPNTCNRYTLHRDMSLIALLRVPAGGQIDAEDTAPAGLVSSVGLAERERALGCTWAKP